MSMLAEPRRKQKLSIDPRGSTWSKDDSKFGQKMLEKFGWSKGKGLGAKEDGNVDHVKVSLKNDSLGLGCSASYADTWIAHQNDFDALLSNLNQSNPSTEKQDKVISLENKSKSSRSRVHYQKFTQGKDLSLKSAKDLDCIFGRRSNKEDSPEESSSSDDNSEDSHSNGGGFVTVKSEQSIQDYFAKKMAGLKQSPRKSSSEPELHSILKEHNKENSVVRETESDLSKKRVSFHIGESDNSEEEVISNQVEENIDKCKKDKKAKKKKNKKRKYESENTDVDSGIGNKDSSIADEIIEQDDGGPVKKKKKSKSAQGDESCQDKASVVDNGDSNEKSKNDSRESSNGESDKVDKKKKKKKKKSKEELDEECKKSDPVEGQLGNDLGKTEKTKKARKNEDSKEQLKNKKGKLKEGLQELGFKSDIFLAKNAKKRKLELDLAPMKNTETKNKNKFKKPKVLEDIEGAFKGSSISDVTGYATHTGPNINVFHKLNKKEKKMDQRKNQRKTQFNSKNLNKPHYNSNTSVWRKKV